MNWWTDDQAAQERNEVLPMPRELTDEEKEAEDRRRTLGPAPTDDLPWWQR
jgi:hypothetical protein